MASPMTQANLKPDAAFRTPRRVTVTLPLHTYEQLQHRCDSEGRSLSNLAAFLLEMALEHRSDRGRTPAALRSLAGIRQ